MTAADLSTADLSVAEASVTDEQLLARFAPIFELIAAGAVSRERERRHPFEEVRALAEAGFGAVRVPQHLGGSGASLTQLFRLLVELGKADSNIPQALRQHFFKVELLLLPGQIEANAELIERVVAGEIFGNATTEAGDAVLGKIGTRITPDAAGAYLLNGKKAYSTGNLYAHWIPVAAVDEADRPVTVLVPREREGVVVHDDWRGFGQKLTASGTTEFVDVRIEEHEVSRYSDPGSLHGGGFHQLLLLAALAGVIAAVARDSVQLVRERKRVYYTGPGVLPVEDPIVQVSVGETIAAEFQARALVDRAASSLEVAWGAWCAPDYDYERDHDRVNALFADAELAVAAAQTVLVPLSLDTAARLFDTVGGSALDTWLQLDRHWRNARTLSSHNPHLYKARMLGDHALNGTLPKGFVAGRDVGRKEG